MRYILLRYIVAITERDVSKILKPTHFFLSLVMCTGSGLHCLTLRGKKNPYTYITVTAHEGRRSIKS